MKLIITLLTALFVFSSAQAGMVSTETLYESQMRHSLITQLSTPELVSAMEDAGLSHEQAVARINRLSSSELSMMQQKLDELPAGGSFVSFLLTLFAILVITDALGYTDLFPFITKPDK